MFMDQDEVKVHKLAKKERGQYPTILTEQTWSIKDLLYGFQGNFSCGIQQLVLSGQDGSILPARVANHSARFGSFLFILIGINYETAATSLGSRRSSYFLVNQKQK